MPEAAGLYYELHGPADAPPLILSSGLGGSAGYWAPNIAALAQRFRVIAYDHRGTGRSDRTLPDDFLVEDMARDILALIDAQGHERADVIGHAAGALAALRLARIAPGRVRRIISVNGWLKADPHFLRCFEVRLNLLRHSGIEAFLRAQPIFLYPAEWISEHDGELNAELIHQIAAFPGIKTMEMRIAALARFDATDWLGKLNTPILAIYSSDDMLVPWTCTESLRGLNRKISISGMSWGGHACNVTLPDAFNRIVLAFLGS